MFSRFCIFSTGLLALILLLALPITAQAGRIQAHKLIELPAPDALLQKPSQEPSQEPAQELLQELFLEAFGQHWQLVLQSHDAFLAGLGTAQVQSLHQQGHRFLAGALKDQPGSWARLNWVDQQWNGLIHDGNELYLIDRADAYDWSETDAPPAGSTVLFRLRDLDPDFLLDADGLSASLQELGQPAVPSAGPFTQIMPVTIIMDTQFQGSHGGNAASIIAGRFNLVDGIYSAQAGISIALHHLEALANNGPLTQTNHSELLHALKDYLLSAPGSSIPFAGLAHLFTSRPRNGGIAGVAFVDTLCWPGWGSGVDWDGNGETTQSLIFAHELGHNFSAPHDGEGSCAHETQRGIMNPSINGSQTFSPCSLEHIEDAVSRASCVVETEPPGYIFWDAFQN